MGLEFKCPICLKLLNHAVSLSCDHIFCSSCISIAVLPRLECPVCRLPYHSQDLRVAPHMDSLVSLYKNIEAVAGIRLLGADSQQCHSDLKKPEKCCSEMGNASIGVSSKTKFKRWYGSDENSLAEKSTGPVFPAKKRLQASQFPGVELSAPSRPENSYNMKIDHAKDEVEGRSRGLVKVGAEKGNNNFDALQLNKDEVSPDVLQSEWSRSFDHAHDPSNSPLSSVTKNLKDERFNLGKENSPQQPSDIKKKHYEEMPGVLFHEEHHGKSKSNHKYHAKEKNRKEIKKQKKLKSRFDNNDHCQENQMVDSVCRMTTNENTLKSKSESESDSLNGTSNSSAEARNPSKEMSPQVSGYVEYLDGKSTVSDASPKEGRMLVFEACDNENLVATKRVVCAFCQFPEDSEASGQMLHYINGKPVGDDYKTQSNSLHVHKKCAEWAPKVYFVGDIAINLESEVARGAKMKCNICGLKGAALGCYAKSCRRTFHVPCAVQAPEFRWDCENFVMLCAVHSSFRLPNEVAVTGRHRKLHHSSGVLEDTRCSPGSSINNRSKNWTDSHAIGSKWVLCGSALNAEEKDFVARFAKLSGAIMSKAWSPDVTHVIASTNGNGACKRTLKFLMAILEGRWILNINWIKGCLKAMSPVSEEPYEIKFDINGSHEGPKNGRLRIMQKVPKLLEGLTVYFSGEFEDSYKGYLEDLVLAAGGTILDTKPDSIALCEQITENPSTIIIYSCEPPPKCKPSQVSSVIDNRFSQAKTLAAQTGANVCGHIWLLDTIAACRLQPFEC
ncbi:hypothetical protein AMTR_s00067p00180030 [Amborella trichopoda]|uniref:RING-type E3 ubiquitin transferase BRCA1 n=2 Tax=Amborella trichopoda TaxID=13333 RepID=U5DES9_AMBTC|nr:hypothetical protein AMTR_s00067p00180030 [Amborella trichopoda]